MFIFMFMLGVADTRMSCPPEHPASCCARRKDVFSAAGFFAWSEEECNYVLPVMLQTLFDQKGKQKEM